MRIGIDAHCIGQRKTGNETYTRNLVQGILQSPANGFHYYVYFAQRYFANGISAGTEFPTGPRFHPRRIRFERPWLRIPVGLALESRAEKLDLFHAQYFLPLRLRCRTVLTIHDVIFERFPGLFTPAARTAYKAYVPWSARRASHVLTVSETSKRDLVEFYGLDPERISVTYPGISETYRPMNRNLAKQQLLERYGLDSDFILYAGAIQPRKNLPRLIEAFAASKRRAAFPHKLVLAGPRSWMHESAFRAVARFRMASHVVWAGYLPAPDLPLFYNAASLFAYPSLYEGFGLPVLEAMACGTPVLTSRGSSLEEIAGGAAALVNPFDVAEISATLEGILSDSDWSARLRSLGIERSRRFSYAQMAKETQHAYERALS